MILLCTRRSVFSHLYYLTRLIGGQRFTVGLRNFILERLGVQPTNGTEYSDAQLTKIEFYKERMYFHRIMRINYTSYDRRRKQDIINPGSKSDIMMLAAPEDQGSHSYYYGRVIANFHVRARPLDSVDDFVLIPVLWIRWFTLTKGPAGAKKRRLFRVSFSPISDAHAFGFIHPSDVIRGVHIVPSFASGKINVEESIARRPTGVDWNYYYVNQ